MSTTGSTTGDGAEPYDPTESDQDTAGVMGVSSQIVGETGPGGQVGTTGLRDVSPLSRTGAEAVAPEQSRGGVEVNPDPPSLPVAGYPSKNPLSGKRRYTQGATYRGQHPERG